MLPIYTHYMTQYANEKDCGALGKIYECAVRESAAGHIVTAVKPSGVVDMYITYKDPNTGKRKKISCEIKTACGEIDVKIKPQLMLYCPEVNGDIDPLKQCFVFSRDEWYTFVTGYPGRGAMLRYDRKRDKYHIQSFFCSTRPKASKALSEYIWDSCYNRPSLSEYLVTLGRQ